MGCFSIKIPGREFLLQADDQKHMSDWVQQLRQSAFMLIDGWRGKRSPLPVPSPDKLAPVLRGMVLPRKVKYNGKVYKDSFTGVELLDHIMRNFFLSTRAEALAHARDMLSAGLITSAVPSSGSEFVDDEIPYSW